MRENERIDVRERVRIIFNYNSHNFSTSVKVLRKFRFYQIIISQMLSNHDIVVCLLVVVYCLFGCLFVSFLIKEKKKRKHWF